MSNSYNLAVIMVGLTDREAWVWSKMRRGMKLTEIAAEMFITVDTVKTHVKAIQAKTGLTHLVRVEMLRRVFVSVDGDGITKERMIVAAARALGCENDRNMEYILKDINLFLKE